MAILITGAAGYIGSHTMVELLNEGYDLIALDNFSNSKPEVLDRIKQLSNRVFKFYEADLLDEASIEKIFEENEIEAVVHFAGYKAVGESVDQPLKYYHNNITGTLILCRIMQKYNVKNIVYSSSATVYGLNNVPPLKETFPLSATNPYGSTKLMIEQILTDLYNSDNQWRIALLRYFNPIGAHPSGRIGEDPKGIPNNLMPYITQVAVGRRERLNIFGNDYDTPDGTGVRDYIHVVDLANGHLAALKRILSPEPIGVEAYNLGAGKGSSVLDVVKNFEEASGIEISYDVCPRRPGDIASCYADVSKAYQELGWKTERTVFDMCRDSWNWQKNNPKGYA